MTCSLHSDVVSCKVLGWFIEVLAVLLFTLSSVLVDVSGRKDPEPQDLSNEQVETQGKKSVDTDAIDLGYSVRQRSPPGKAFQ